MEKILPTRGQLERQLSQTLQLIYRQQFGHSVSKVSCHIFDNKVAIIAEDTITDIEKSLLGSLQLELVSSIRTVICKTFKVHVKQAIADVLHVEAIELLGSFNIDSGYLSMLVILNNAPEIRLVKSHYHKNNNYTADN